jgi:hypothetical protein
MPVERDSELLQGSACLGMRNDNSCLGNFRFLGTIKTVNELHVQAGTFSLLEWLASELVDWNIDGLQLLLPCIMGGRNSAVTARVLVEDRPHIISLLLY